MKPIIQTTDIFKSFGKSQVLSGMSLTIEQSTIYGLVGLNGVGKTTFLRLLLGLLKPDQGSISILGYDPWHHSEDFYSKIGVVLEHDGFWGNLTIKENLKIYASAKKLVWSDVLLYIDQFWSGTVITDSNKSVKHLSRGQRVQCALCRAFLGWPKVMFFDEPAIALDMTAYNHLKKIAVYARDKGASMIVSSHQLDTIDDLCDRVGNLSGGKLSDLELNVKGCSQWVLSADTAFDPQKILLENGSKNPVKEDEFWFFDIREPRKSIPVIIRMLVDAGCQIYEIKENSTGFGSTLRSMYKTK